MVKKMKLPFLSYSKSLDPKLSSSPPWPFPSCGGNIKTLSFRAKDDNNNDGFRTFNSAFLETELTPPESFFTISSSSRSFSTLSEDSGDPVETVIRGLRSDRLFFEPERSSSLLLREHENKHEHEQEEEEEQEEEIVLESPDSKVVYKESEIMSMDSNSPYEDFRRSMEEMVEAHGLKDWQGLEELLGCYLKINGKNNHGYIVGAFIDLLVSLSFESFVSTSSTSTTTTRTTTTTTRTTSSSSYSNYSSPSSPLSLPSSSLTTPCLSSILDHGDDGNVVVDDDDNDDDDDDGDDGDDDHVIDC
ncbi:transcription repressor OFP13 [Beta vulgaris subsp. vulgaris]|uniref:transcription repressor OFP13 n=1 Tax=Beta vulgaris subsp. vulgaris TaxID=3555 RepID=UPI002546A1B9|nr:transcription repressor OFP13 [Beta vulgaris subsp. vulgaris]